MGRTFLNLPFFAAALCLLLSCGQPVVYHQYQPVPAGGWEKESEVCFTFMIEDAAATYNVLLEISNDRRYPYQNLWLFCREELPSGIVRRDTVQCLLADDNGKWLGMGLSLFTTTVPLRSGYTFPMPGQYSLCFRQGMRRNALPGINAIGLKVERGK